MSTRNWDCHKATRSFFFRPWIQADINRWRFPLLLEETFLEATKCCLRCPFGWEWQALHDRSRSTDGSHPSILVTLDACWCWCRWPWKWGWYVLIWDDLICLYKKKPIVVIHHGQVLSFVASRFLQHKPEWARALNGCCGRNMHQPWIVLPFTFRSFTMRPWSQIGTHDCWQKIVSLLELPEGYGGYV